VKGLDYALLAKVKSDLKQQEGRENEDRGDRDQPHRQVIINSGGMMDAQTEFKTMLGKRIYHQVMGLDNTEEPSQDFLPVRWDVFFCSY